MICGRHWLERKRETFATRSKIESIECSGSGCRNENPHIVACSPVGHWLRRCTRSSRVSPDEAAAIAARIGHGRVLAVEKSSSGGREVYRVKVLTPNGEVRVILIDAETGNKL